MDLLRLEIIIMLHAEPRFETRIYFFEMVDTYYFNIFNASAYKL